MRTCPAASPVACHLQPCATGPVNSPERSNGLSAWDLHGWQGKRLRKALRPNGKRNLQWYLISSFGDSCLRQPNGQKEKAPFREPILIQLMSVTSSLTWYFSTVFILVVMYTSFSLI